MFDSIRLLQLTAVTAMVVVAMMWTATSACAQVPRPARMVSLTEANQAFETASRAANELIGISVERADANGAVRRWDASWSTTLADLGTSLDASCSRGVSDCEARAINALACDLAAEVDVARRRAFVDAERLYEWPNLARSMSARRRLADAALQRRAAGLSCEDLPGVWAVYGEDAAQPVLATERELIRRARTATSRSAQAAPTLPSPGSSLSSTTSPEQARVLVWRLYGTVIELASVMRRIESMDAELRAGGTPLGAGLALVSTLPVAFSRHDAVSAEVRSADYEACISTDATVRGLLCGIGFDISRADYDFDIAQRATSEVERDREKRRAWERLGVVLEARVERVSRIATVVGQPADGR